MTSSDGWTSLKASDASKPPLITLTTDFGTSSPYVAAMKGVILSCCPAARLLDLSHDIPPQNLLHAAIFLCDALPWFPPQTIHIAVIDPGVGTARLPICVALNGYYLLCPDNGLWSLIKTETLPHVYHLADKQYQLPAVSNVFHGRDIFAPAAAALGSGITPEQLGPRLNDWKKLSLPVPRLQGSDILGEVIFIDHFGNVMTNIPAGMLPARINEISIGRHHINKHVPSYGHAQPNEVVGLFSSSGHLEIAQVNGNAANKLGIAIGESVKVN